MNTLEYQLIRSARKTVAIEIRGTQVIVRAPFRYAQKRIDAFVAEHEEWIKAKIAKNAEKSRAIEQIGFLSEAEIRDLTVKAREYIPQRTAMFAAAIGVSYGTVTVRCQRTKWGSCSSKGNLNFNCLLMLTPPQVIDCIVVHELCHRKEMNHSKRFYEEVYKAYPEYDKWHKWLKENGSAIMGRVK